MIRRMILAGTLAVGLALIVSGLTMPTSAQVFGQNQNITVVDSGTACVTAPTACATFALDSVSGGITISISGTWTGTLTFEGTNNDGVWTAVLLTNLATGARVTSTTASGLFGVGNAGFIKIRVRATAAVTGSALVTAAKGLGQPSADFFSGGPLSASTGSFTGDVTSGGHYYAADGTALLPAYSFTSEPTLGFWRSGAGTTTHQGAMTLTGSLFATLGAAIGTNSNFSVQSKLNISATSDGNMVVRNNAGTIGSQLKVDALPTIASGFGTTPAVTAGSTPLAGSVNVGTGAPGTTGTITFGGTAFPSAPFCVVTAQGGASSNGLKALASTTQLVLSAAGSGFTAGDIIQWICISSK